MLDGPITYNTKCILQGAFVLGIWYGSYSGTFPDPTNKEERGWKTGLFALLLFYLVYVGNAILDLKYGCDHGTVFDSFK